MGDPKTKAIRAIILEPSCRQTNMLDQLQCLYSSWANSYQEGQCPFPQLSATKENESTREDQMYVYVSTDDPERPRISLTKGQEGKIPTAKLDKAEYFRFLRCVRGESNKEDTKVALVCEQTIACEDSSKKGVNK